MSSSNDATSHYHGVLLEDMDSKLDAVLEGQAALADVPARLTKLETAMDRVETDLKAVKAAVKDEFKELRRRVGKLEEASAR